MEDQKLGKMILIDDDRTFGRIMLRCAEEMGVRLDYYESLEHLGYVSLVGEYDVAILDYDLGSMTGLEIGEYLTAFFSGMPMLLISATNRTATLSESKQGIGQPFLLKGTGPELILATALALNNVNAMEA